MLIDLEPYRGSCSCGRDHEITTKTILIESGAAKKLLPVLDKLDLKPPGGCVVCDSNTRRFADWAADCCRVYLNKARPIVTLKADDLCADENAVQDLEAAVPEDAAWLMAAGAGTIHDIVRFVAAKRKIPFVSFPTAATSNGFATASCDMRWHGFQRVMPGVPPLAVVADLDVIAATPYRLNAAGIGEALGAYTALADWKCGATLADEEFCDVTCSLLRKAVDTLVAYIPAIHAREAVGFEKLAAALILPGVAAQMRAGTRPVQGAERNLVQLWEMNVLNRPINALRGEKTGVALLLALRYYEKIAALPPNLIKRKIQPYSGLPLEYMRKRLGRHYDEVFKENQPDPLRIISMQRMTERFPMIAAAIAELPAARLLRPVMQAAGCKTTMEEIGLARETLPESLFLAPYMQRGLTILRAAKMLPMPGTSW